MSFQGSKVGLSTLPVRWGTSEIIDDKRLKELPEGFGTNKESKMYGAKWLNSLWNLTEYLFVSCQFLKSIVTCCSLLYWNFTLLTVTLILANCDMNMSHPIFCPMHFTCKPSFYQWRPFKPRSCSTGTCTAPHCLPHRRWVSTRGWRWIVTCQGKNHLREEKCNQENANESCSVNTSWYLWSLMITLL